MSDRLARIIEAQHALQVKSFGHDPLTLIDEARCEYILWNAYALADELHELTNEVGWKPWATSKHVNEAAAIGEFSDMLHFLINLLLAVAPRGSSVEDVADILEKSYFAKRRVNEQRQAEGYDGVSSKCRACRRALDDAGRDEIRLRSGEVKQFCGACGAMIVSEAHADSTNGSGAPTS